METGLVAELTNHKTRKSHARVASANYNGGYTNLYREQLRVQSAKSAKQPSGSTLNAMKYRVNDVRGALFDKQLSREEQITPFINVNSVGKDSPHDRRFEITTDLTSITSKKRHSVALDWSKASPKKTLLNQIKKTFYYCGDYTPNYENVKQKLNTGCVSFNKQVGRGSLVTHHHNSSNKDLLSPSYFSQKSFSCLGHVKKQQLVGFSKVIPRDNSMYYISEHINLKEVEKLIRKKKGKYSVFEMGTHVTMGARRPMTSTSNQRAKINKGSDENQQE